MALQRPVSAIHFRPQEQLLGQADQLLAEAEGATLEEMAGRLARKPAARRSAIFRYPSASRATGIDPAWRSIW